MRRENFYEAIKKVVEEGIKDGITPCRLKWIIEVLSLIRDLIYEEKVEEAIETIEDWAERKEKNVGAGLSNSLWEIREDLSNSLWEIRKETWLLKARLQGWDYITYGVLRDFTRRMAELPLSGCMDLVAKIYSLMALALKKDGKRTVNVLIDVMDKSYMDLDTLISRLEEILDTR